MVFPVGVYVYVLTPATENDCRLLVYRDVLHDCVCEYLLPPIIDVIYKYAYALPTLQQLHQTRIDIWRQYLAPEACAARTLQLKKMMAKQQKG